MPCATIIATFERTSASHEQKTHCPVALLARYKGSIYDPACGSGGMFVQSEKFMESQNGRSGDVLIYSHKTNARVRRMDIDKLTIRDIDTDFGPEETDTFRLYLRNDYVLAKKGMLQIFRHWRHP